MIQTTLIPENSTLSIIIPNSYVGKKVYALIYTDEELVVSNPRSTNIQVEDKIDNANIEQNEKWKQLTISPLVSSLTGVLLDKTTIKDDYYDYLTQKYR